MKTRLHLHTNKGPKTRAYIVAEPQALRELARAAESAARSVVGMETVTFYTSDGHEYELFIACDLTEDDWQQLPVPYDKKSDPEKLNIVQIYNELKNSI
ncbi:MAG: hypothetical protein RLZZ196_1577 [Bacteroidota bacterium]|jgi:hypothetical protein